MPLDNCSDRLKWTTWPFPSQLATTIPSIGVNSYSTWLHRSQMAKSLIDPIATARYCLPVRSPSPRKTSNMNIESLQEVGHSVSEPIPVECLCGAHFRVKPQAAGKTIHCPKCKRPNKVSEPVSGDRHSAIDIPPTVTPPDIDELELDGLPDINLAPAIQLDRASSNSFSDINATTPAGTFSPASTAYQKPVTARPNAPQPRRYRALEIVSTMFKVMALASIAVWVLTTGFLCVMFVIGIVRSDDGPELPSLPAGVTAYSDLNDPNLTPNQQTALISYQLAKQARESARNATPAVAALGIVPWFGFTVSTVLSVCFLWACAELFRLAIDVQSNTFDAAYG